MTRGKILKARNILITNQKENITLSDEITYDKNAEKLFPQEMFR